MMMPERKFSVDGYRYGFNGQEIENEISGMGNSYSAEFWQYDPRIGRRWNVDPKYVADESPYAVNRNNPIAYTDPKGDFPGLGFLVGFVTEFVIQTVEIKFKLRTEYDVSSMLVSGIATQVGMGVAKQINRVKGLTQIGKGVLQFNADVAISGTEQYIRDGDIDVGDAILNASISSVAGHYFDAQARASEKYRKMTKIVKQAENSVSSSNQPVKARTIENLNKAVNSREDYVAAVVTIKTVPAVNIAGRIKDNIENNSSTASTTTQETKASVQEGIPNIRGLSKFVDQINKKFGSLIENISYTVTSENNVGVNIIWKNNKGGTAVSFDNRFTNQQMPTPPPSN